MKKGYYFGSDASREQIMAALGGLMMEAQEEARINALRYLQTDDEKHARTASHYDGKREILASLRWAFSGEASNDGCDPTVSIE